MLATSLSVYVTVMVAVPLAMFDAWTSTYLMGVALVAAVTVTVVVGVVVYLAVVMVPCGPMYVAPES